MRLIAAVAAALVVPCLTLRAMAEEPPAPAPAPAALPALPAPAAAQAWSFVGDMIVNGSPLGTIKHSMEVATHEGAPAWKAVDALEVGTERDGVRVRGEALLDARLVALAGTTVSEATGEPTVTLTWRRDGASYRVTRREGEKETEAVVPAAEGRIATLAAQIHLLRVLPGAPATYRVPELLVDPNVGDDPARRVTELAVEVLEPGPFEHDAAKPAAARGRVVRRDDPGRAMRVWLAVEGRALLGLDQPESGFVVRARKEAPPAGDGPPRSVKEAALRSARALAVGDAQALGRLLHWDTVDARLAKDADFAGLEPAARRARLLKKLDEQLEENPPQVIDMVLQGMDEALQLDDLGGGRTRVTFPPVFRSMRLVVVKVGEAWLLDDLPGAP
jgi:hypothetical protein